MYTYKNLSNFNVMRKPITNIGKKKLESAVDKRLEIKVLQRP